MRTRLERRAWSMHTNVGGAPNISAFQPRRVHWPFLRVLGWPYEYVAIKVHTPGSAWVYAATSGRGGCKPMSRVPPIFLHPNRAACIDHSCEYWGGHTCTWAWKSTHRVVRASTTRPPGVVGANCDNTPSLPHPVGGKASQAVSPGSPVGEYPPRKETPNSTHARRRPGEDAPSDKRELCDRKFTCPRRGPRGNTHASPSYPIRSPQTLRKTPPQTPSRDPQKTLPQTPSKEPQKTLPSGHMGPVSAEGGPASDTVLSRGGGRVLAT